MSMPPLAEVRGHGGLVWLTGLPAATCAFTSAVQSTLTHTHTHTHRHTHARAHKFWQMYNTFMTMCAQSTPLKSCLDFTHKSSRLATRILMSTQPSPTHL